MGVDTTHDIRSIYHYTPDTTEGSAYYSFVSPDLRTNYTSDTFYNGCQTEGPAVDYTDSMSLQSTTTTEPMIFLMTSTEHLETTDLMGNFIHNNASTLQLIFNKILQAIPPRSSEPNITVDIETTSDRAICGTTYISGNTIKIATNSKMTIRISIGYIGNDGSWWHYTYYYAGGKHSQTIDLTTAPWGYTDPEKYVNHIDVIIYKDNIPIANVPVPLEYIMYPNWDGAPRALMVYQ